MGTNYYKQCEHCDNKIHLGKSSVGLRYTIQANGYKFYKSWLEMKTWLEGKK